MRHIQEFIETARESVEDSYGKGMRKQVRDFCAKCMVCNRNKRATGTKAPLCPLKTPFQYPRAVMAYDIATLPWSSDGFRYVLVMVDHFSKQMEAYPMRNQEAKSIETALEHGWCRRHGYPLVVLSDQGKNVDGERISKWCDRMGVEKRRSSPYHPEGDGQVERTIQTFKQTLGCLLEDGHIEKTNWPALLQEITFACNGLPNASTGFSPHHLMFGAPYVRQSMHGPIRRRMRTDN